MTQIETDENSPVDGGMAPKRGKTISREDLNTLIQEVENHPFKLDDKWYIVAQDWWRKVITAAKNGFVDDVPPVDCSSISTKNANGYILKPKMAESIDFVVLPRVVFEKLREVYSLDDPDRDFIERSVVEKNDQLSVEIYPRVVSVSLARDSSVSCELRLKGGETMSDLRDQVLKELKVTDVTADSIRFYINLGDTNERIDPTEENVNAYFDTAQKVLVDVKDSDGNWFILEKAKPTSGSMSLFGSGSAARWFLLLYRSIRALSNWRWLISAAASILFRFHLLPYSSYSSSSSSYSGMATRNRQSYTKGVCGLYNLGNTCFMASALQCLSNVPPLTEYFCSGEYVKDINTLNPLGTKGELAKAYGDLMQMMWSGENGSVQPRKLKTTIGQFAPRFSGYAQQDSQELLAYLLDGLHEDLNRVKVKPYIQEDEEMEKLEEHKKAEESWKMYRARNDSVIVDKIHGQLKSTLVCPVCAKVSIKFDPFCFLSLPLPPKERVSKQYITLMYNGSPKKKWAKFAIAVSRTTTAHVALSLMRANLGVNEEDLHLVLFAVGESSDDVTIIDSDEVVVSDDRPRDLYAAQVDRLPLSSQFVIVKNVLTGGRSASLPMIYSVPDKKSVTRSFLTEKALRFTREAFHNSSVPSASKEDINGEDKDPFKLFMVQQGKIVALPETEDEETIEWPVDAKHFTVVFQWREPKLFNNYRGADLIDRECTIPQRKEIHLTDCIDLFTKTEQLGEDDSWYCPRCKKHERASKKLELWNLPEVLIIHLKRFQYSRWSRDKIDIPVNIPVSGFELNSKLANERHEHVKYDLIAMSHHMGGLGGGHYTATARNKITGKWYDFNDTSASPTSAPPENLISRSPYMLVYRRQNADDSDATVPATVVEVPAGGADSNMDMETD